MTIYVYLHIHDMTWAQASIVDIQDFKVEKEHWIPFLAMWEWVQESFISRITCGFISIQPYMHDEPVNSNGDSLIKNNWTIYILYNDYNIRLNMN